MEDRSAGLVPSRARTCEHKVDTPHQPPYAPHALATALIFHMISLPPVLRLALVLQAGCFAVPFSTGQIITETCFIIMALRHIKGSKMIYELIISSTLWKVSYVLSCINSDYLDTEKQELFWITVQHWQHCTSMILVRFFRCSWQSYSVVLLWIRGRHCLLQNNNSWANCWTVIAVNAFSQKTIRIVFFEIKSQY